MPDQSPRAGISLDLLRTANNAITINPAKICGLDHRLGSLEVGKDADLVLFDQDPLTIAAKPKMVIAGGKLV